MATRNECFLKQAISQVISLWIMDTGINFGVTTAATTLKPRYAQNLRTLHNVGAARLLKMRLVRIF